MTHGSNEQKNTIMGFGCFVDEHAMCYTTSVGCGGVGHSCAMDSNHTLCTSGSKGALICRYIPDIF